MSRIGGIGNLKSAQYSAIRRINELTAAIAQNTERLSTLKRINSARDDPSGLVHATTLRQEITAADETISGIARANAILSTADGAALQVLTDLQSARALALASADGTLSASQVAANQLQIDSLLQGIDNLSKTEFSGRRLLDGTSSFRTSGVDTSEILDVDVLSKQTADDVTVAIEVTQQATQATDTYDNSTPLAADATLIVDGVRGSATFTLSSGATTQDIVDAFNSATYLTGISATVNGTDVELTSADYGSNATIEIEATTGTFNTASGNSAQGTDAVATINGQQYTGDGTTFNVNTSQLALEIELDASANGTLSSFVVSGEGLEFLVGTSPSSTARIGMPRLNTSSLGGIAGKLSSIMSGGSNSLSGGNAAAAMRIIDDAIGDVTRSEAIIGSFQKYTLDSASNVLGKTVENLTSALSEIEDADVAVETALLSNNQLLQQTAFEALSISTSSNSNVLALLQSVAARF